MAETFTTDVVASVKPPHGTKYEPRARSFPAKRMIA